MKRVVICGNRHQDRYLPGIGRLLDLLRGSGIEICIERRFAEYLIDRGKIAVAPAEIVDEMPADSFAAISIGGDGTFLRTARWIGRSATPVLGINTGHLGFLANYDLDEAPSLVETLLTGDADIERRAVLHLTGEGLPDCIFPYALNEVALLKEDTSSMISVHLDVDSIFLADYMADGLIVSTPTGSTGYNLSAGGPILQPTLDCVCVSPVAPHTLTLRPIVLSGDSSLTARVSSRTSRYRVSLDGVSFVMTTGTDLTITKADFEARILRRPDDNFPSTLRHKLLWGQR